MKSSNDSVDGFSDSGTTGVAGVERLDEDEWEMEEGSESKENAGEGGSGVISGRIKSLDTVEPSDEEDEDLDLEPESCEYCNWTDLLGDGG